MIWDQRDRAGGIKGEKKPLF